MTYRSSLCNFWLNISTQEILTCYGERILLSKKTPGRRKSRAPVAASSDWLTVLMDLLLGLLSYHNQFWRNVTERVFLWLKGSLTAEVIQVIIKVCNQQLLLLIALESAE